MSQTIKFSFKLNVDGKEQLVTTTANAKELQKALNEARTPVERLTQQFFQMNQAVESFKNIAGAVRQLTDTLNSVTEESRTFSAAMASANTMAGKSGKDFEEMKDDVVDLAKEVPMARDALANGLYQVISNGVPENNWISFLRDSAKASVGGIADLGETVKVTSTMIKNYGLSWSDAGKIQDKIQLTAKNGVTSFEQLAQALPRVAANAATLGVSVDELMASFATLTGVSGNTAEVSTQIAAIFTALIKPSSEATKMAQAMGIEFDAASVKAAGGLQNFLKQLDSAVNAYSTKSGKLTQEIYGKLFGSAESLRALTPLTGNLSAKFAENIDAMKDSTGTIEDAFKTMGDTGAAKTQLLQNKFAGLRDTITNFVAPVLPALNFSSQLGMSVVSVLALQKALASFGITAKVSAVATVAQSVASKIAAAAQFLWTQQLRYARQAQIAWAFSAKLATVQAIAMRAAILGLMAVTGVGIAVAAVAGIISLFASKTGDTVEALGDASSAMTSVDRVTNQYKEAMKGISSSVSSEEQKLDTLNDTLNDNNAKLKDKQKALAEIKSLVPQVNATIDSEGKVHGDASSAIATHIRMLKALQTAMAAYNAGQKIKNEQSENELALEVAKDKYNRSSRTLEKIRADYYKNENGKYFETNYSSAGLSYNVPTKLGRGALNMMGDAYKGMQTAQKEMTAAQIKVTESSQDVITAENFYKKKLIQQAKEAGVTSKEIDKAIRESNGDWAKATSILFNRNETPTADTTSTTKTGRSGKADTKIFNSAAVTTKEISDNISVLQEKLSKTDPKTEKYKAISDAIKVWQERLDDINRGYELGSIADYEAQISKVDSQLKNLNLKEEERNALIKQREELQQKADALSNANVEKGSLDDLNNQMQKLQKQFNATGSLEARLKIKAEINDLQAQIDAQTDGKLTIPAETEPTYIEPGSEADKRRSYQNAQSKAQGIQSDVQSGVIDTATAEKRIKELNGQLQSLGLQPINIDLNIDTSQIDEAANIIKDLAGSFGGTASSITNQFEGLALSFNDIAKKAQEAKKNSDGTGQSFNATAAYAAAGAAGVAALGDAMQQAGADGAAAKIGATLAAIGQIALGFASAAASPAVTSTGWGWLAFVGAGLAAMAVAISTIQSYATGGIVGGSSYTGDKLTAHVNSGEMILNMQQQRRLFAIANGDVTPKITLPTYNNRAMLNTTGLNGGGMIDLSGIDWRLRGPDIVAAVANTTRIGARSGRKSNIAV